jgi:hypothetical protein
MFSLLYGIRPKKMDLKNNNSNNNNNARLKSVTVLGETISGWEVGEMKEYWG